MDSAIYEGVLYHARTKPRANAFNYKVFMVLVYLDELDDFFSLSPFWSHKKFSLARFKREDYFGPTQQALDISIRRKVQSELGFYPEGRVALLTNVRYWGVKMNPLNTYYCMDENDQLVAIVAEVNNTPWNEQHAYVLDCRNFTDKRAQFECKFAKVFTVSPFNGVDMHYLWRSNLPDKTITISIDTQHGTQSIVRAKLCLTRSLTTARQLNIILLKYPVMTLKVVGAIYWQALKLFVKGVPFLGKNKKQPMTYLE